MRLRAGALIVAVALAGSSAAAGAAPKSHPLQDLYYGNVLFHYLQKDEFGALTQLLAARAQNRAQAHAVDGDLLMAGLLLTFGQTQDAMATLERLLQSQTSPEARDRAWLILARSLHERGAQEQALAALGRIEGVLGKDFEAERQMLSTEILIESGRHDEAVTAVTAWKDAGSDWLRFARYNLGVALIRADRVDEGIRQLAMVDTMPTRTEEEKALRDRANTAVAYTQLRAEQFEAARQTLHRVRLEGPSSNQALLALGWAESELGRDRDALVPWMELAGRDIGDRAVHEAMLAVPYALARAGLPNAAVERYQGAVVGFERATRHLATVAIAVDQPAFIERLLQASPAVATDAGVAQTAPAPTKLPQAPEYRELSELIASDAFQAGLRNCRELAFVRQNLANWAARAEELSRGGGGAAWQPQTARIATLLADTDAVLARQKRQLQEQALAEVRRRQDRLGNYALEARLAQARVLDRSAAAAKAPKAGGQP